MTGSGLRRGLLLGAALSALLVTQMVWVRPTNFAGYDEWLVLSLVERGILAVPHANRPLGLLPAVPTALFPHSFGAYFVLGGIYALLSAVLTALLVTRLVPNASTLAFLAGVLVILWGPSDAMRLAAVQTTLYHGISFATMLGLFLLVESWERASAVLLATAAAVALACVRTYEATLPLLLGAPVLLVVVAGRRTPRLWAWMFAWELVAILGLGLAFLGPDESRIYQSGLTADLAPANVVRRLLNLYWHHSAPLWTPRWTEFAAPAVLCTTLVFAVLYAFWTRGTPEWPTQSSERRSCAALASLGFAGAGLGHLAFAVTPSVGAPLRTEFLAGPGMSLLLAATATLVASTLPPAWRRSGLGALAAWVVAVGAARTAAMQADWDRLSAYSNQRRVLLRLIERVPDVAPHTLIVMLDDEKVWRSVGGFRFAIEYLYEGRASGFVPGVMGYNTSTTFAPDGVVSKLVPEVSGAWGGDDGRYGYDEIVVTRLDPSGELALLTAWPSSLSPLPEGSHYSPLHRIRSSAATIANRRVLTLE